MKSENLMSKEFKFGKKPSEVHADIKLYQQADSSLAISAPFKLPLLKIKYQNEVINIFEKAIEVLAGSPDIATVLEKQPFYDMDLSFLKSSNPQIKQWREWVPSGKTLPVAQLYPQAYSGRKCYQGFFTFEFDYEFQDSNEKVKKNGVEVAKKSKVMLKDEKGENLLRFADVRKFKDESGAKMILYHNTFKTNLKEEFTKDANGNIVAATEDPTVKEFIYRKTQVTIKGELMKYVEEIFAAYLEYYNTLSADEKAKRDKLYCYFLTNELKEPEKTSNWAVPTCFIDHIVFI